MSAELAALPLALGTGIGGGIIKVPLMHLVMGVPLRVATATSNLMIGITAAASAVIYLSRGEIDPYVAGPTAIGVFLGATLGSRIAPRVDLRYLRAAFVVVLIGERPGLSPNRSLGAYITRDPRVGRTDAAARIADVLTRARAAGVTGVTLDATPALDPGP